MMTANGFWGFWGFVERGDWSARAGYQSGFRTVELGDVTAVFCANDRMALCLLRALHESGRSIRGDISVVGFRRHS
uniref:substrate-binding domain-containing protein n=1 Tax=Streptomyces sp. NBC_01001 TaxID=2903713 RepID=UPI002F913217|nr:substrate-binding domain-containing protein [Streptomyces sp. NBC_01001]